MTTAIRKPTRMEQIRKLNAQIDRLIEGRDNSRSRGERKAYEYDINRCRRERDALELSLYEQFGVTVDR